MNVNNDAITQEVRAKVTQAIARDDNIIVIDTTTQEVTTFIKNPSGKTSVFLNNVYSGKIDNDNDVINYIVALRQTILHGQILGEIKETFRSEVYKK